MFLAKTTTSARGCSLTPLGKHGKAALRPGRKQGRKGLQPSYRAAPLWSPRMDFIGLDLIPTEFESHCQTGLQQSGRDLWLGPAVGLRAGRRELLAVAPAGRGGYWLGTSPRHLGTGPAAAKPQPKWTGDGLERGDRHGDNGSSVTDGAVARHGWMG